MNNRIWTLATAIACIAIIALGLVIGILPKLAEGAASELTRVGVDSQNAIYEGELVRLQKEFEKLDEIVEELQGLQESLPADAGQSEWVRQINAAALSTGVFLLEFNQEPPVLYGSFDAAGNPAQGQQPISGGTLLGIPVTMKVQSTDLHALYAFVRPLQQGERLFMVSSMSLKGNPVGDTGYLYELTVIGYIYTLADPAAATSMPEPTPTETPTPEPTETPGSVPTESPTPTQTVTP